MKKNRQLLPYTVNDPHAHSMGKSLTKYVDIKMHQLIKDVDSDLYDEIIIIGDYDRSVVISKYEKGGKLTNWQRPTAEVINNTLYIKCFPGIDYVRHYASLISSYLAINGKRFDHVTYILPSEEKCWNEIYKLELDALELTDAIVVGSGLFNFTDTGTVWQGTDKFLWAVEQLPNGKNVTYLIVQFSFWGDIFYRLVTYLGELGHKKIIFTAKVGGINPTIIPNQVLATGNLGYINGEIIKWDNPFFGIESDLVYEGTHINSPSVMYESKDWVKLFKDFPLVDSEIGYFAKAAFESGMEFGYLHFVSNNLSRLFKEDLSNERSKSITEKREKLNKDIERIIKKVI